MTSRHAVFAVRGPVAAAPDPGPSGTARLINIATRVAVGGVAGTPIPGFVLSGTGSKVMLLRAVGPTLAGFSVGGVLADPQFSLLSGTTTVATNDNWSSADNAAAISSAATAVGAFALAPGSRDAALLVDLAADAYSAVISGVGNATGTALVELYAVAGTTSDPPASVSVVAPGATLTRLASGLHFTEGPASDAAGNVFFSDITGDTIYRWSIANQLSVFRSNSGGTNGLAFDRGGNLVACEGDNGRLVFISPQGNVTVLTDSYGGQRYNEPNDLWIDPAGGVYFTDPVYFNHPVVQGGEHVYYTIRFVAEDRGANTYGFNRGSRGQKGKRLSGRRSLPL